MRWTRETTTGGALPSASICSTRARAATMSASVGAGGDTGRASLFDGPRTLSNHDLSPTCPLAPRTSSRAAGQLGQVERARRVAGIVVADPVEIGLRLLHLGLEDTD